MSQINFMSRNNLSKTNSPSIFYLDGLRLYVFENPKGETKFRFNSNFFNY